MRCPALLLLALPALGQEPPPRTPYVESAVSAADGSIGDIPVAGLVTLYGSRLAARSESAGAVPWPETLAGSRIELHNTASNRKVIAARNPRPLRTRRRPAVSRLSPRAQPLPLAGPPR